MYRLDTTGEKHMSAIHWFEISVKDINRAKTFYETVLNAQIPVADMREAMGSMIGMLPTRDGVGGALVENSQQGYEPSESGTLVYLVVDGDLDATVAKVEAAGGTVKLPKTPLGEGSGGGYVAWIGDTEGNKVGLFSQS
jgi:predicted enzyme related to lactoylglutathione lyase